MLEHLCQVHELFAVESQLAQLYDPHMTTARTVVLDYFRAQQVLCGTLCSCCEAHCAAAVRHTVRCAVRRTVQALRAVRIVPLGIFNLQSVPHGRIQNILQQLLFMAKAPIMLFVAAIVT